jgi:hypothetical protein
MLHYIAYFFGGAFLANAIPHWVAGLMGEPFQTPFADPPGKGLSSSTLNVCWAAFNFLVAYMLLAQVGSFDWRTLADVGSAGAGGLAMSLFASWTFGKLHGGDLSKT